MSNQDKIDTQLQWVEVIVDVEIEVCPDTGRAQLMLRKMPIKAVVMVGSVDADEDEDEFEVEEE